MNKEYRPQPGTEQARPNAVLVDGKTALLHPHQWGLDQPVFKDLHQALPIASDISVANRRAVYTAATLLWLKSVNPETGTLDSEGFLIHTMTDKQKVSGSLVHLARIAITTDMPHSAIRESLEVMHERSSRFPNIPEYTRWIFFDRPRLRLHTITGMPTNWPKNHQNPENVDLNQPFATDHPLSYESWLTALALKEARDEKFKDLQAARQLRISALQRFIGTHGLGAEIEDQFAQDSLSSFRGAIATSSMKGTVSNKKQANRHHRFRKSGALG